jgi:hypothetical protein
MIGGKVVSRQFTFEDGWFLWTVVAMRVQGIGKIEVTIFRNRIKGDGNEFV